MRYQIFCAECGINTDQHKTQEAADADWNRRMKVQLILRLCGI